MPHILVKNRFSLACAAVVLLASGCGGSSKSSDCPKGQVNFGVEPYASDDTYVNAYKGFAGALSDALGCPVKLVPSSTYTGEVAAMRKGKLDVAEFGALGYIFASRLAKARALATFGDTGGQPDVNHAGLWVKKGSPITSVTGLRGAKLALATPTSVSGGFYPLYALSSNGLTTNDVNVQYVGGHQQALDALKNGTADAAEINSKQLASSKAAKQFDPTQYTRIWKSSAIPNDPLVVRGDLPAKFQAAVKDALLHLTTAQLSAVQSELGVASLPLIPADDSLYDGMRTVIDANKVPFSALND